MFSQGQLIFALCFFIAFVIVMIFAYRKDLALHRIFYKGNYKVFLSNSYKDFIKKIDVLS